MTEKPQADSENSSPDIIKGDSTSLKGKDFGQGKTIVLVEDDRTTSAMLKAILKGVLFEVVEAIHGKDAWYKLKPEIKPCLFICDIIMPEMDGFNLFKQLKQNKETENIPVLIISSRKAMADTFLTLGADAFLAKPINTQEFLEIVHKLSARGAKILEESGATPKDTPDETTRI